ncbi:MAG: hypothetical protein V4584_17660 [Verrucomicrobiota bacterium]
MKPLILFFLLMIPAFGRLGETLEQCRVRYGKETKVLQEKPVVRLFRKDGFDLSITFAKEVARQILVTRTPDAAGSRGKDLAEAEAKAFLEANGNGSPWVSEFGGMMYSTKDGQRSATKDKESLLMAFDSDL